MRFAALLVIAVAAAGCLSSLTGGGVSAKDLVSDDEYSNWIIEIDHVNGERPSGEVVNGLLSRLQDVVSKDSVRVQYSDANLPSDDRWTRGELQSLRESRRDLKTEGNTVTTHVMFVDGEYEQEGVLGFAVGHDWIVIFSERIDRGCDEGGPLGLPACSDADRTRAHTAVLVHEFGHIMGLVNNGIDMVNDHEADRCNGEPDSGHSDNQNSVMFCAVRTVGLFGLQSIPTEFDADDRRDLCAAGGRC
ncbi:MAG: hypothetical protein ACPHID_04680 [Thermoplasmatota archaeon]